VDDARASNRSSSGFEPGDRVSLRGREWTVVQRATYADCEALRVEPVEGQRARTFLLPFDRPRRSGSGRLAVVSTRAWFHTFARLLLAAYRFGGLRHCPASIDVIPYQLEPALAMLRHGHSRVLLADGVGMGKTIEAALIARELAGRQDSCRILILVPAGLREQWAGELARCDLRAAAVDAAWLRHEERHLPPEVNPWSPPGIYLASMDFVKRPEALRPLEDVRWDLVVVDEAHNASIGTDRRAAIDAIASRAHRVLLLTGTPPPDRLQFAALCRIGAAPGEPDIATFRRERPREGRPGRRETLLAVRITEDERRMHRMLERYSVLVWREAGRAGNADARLATITLRKRALSSAASLAISVRRRRALLAGLALPLEQQLPLPLDEADDESAGDLVPDEILGAAGLSDLTSELRWLDAILGAAAAASEHEAKARVLLRLLKRIAEPVIVFTEFRDTLERLREVLAAAGRATEVLHGGLDAAGRRKALAGFARGRTTLLATDAAAEGLNLQRACRAIVHYELPWNPARLLQRAGRVDRIGQDRRVHEIALVASDTAELFVLAPLVRRGRSHGATHGGRMLQLLTESRVAEAVFEEGQLDLRAEPARSDPCLLLDLSAEGESEALRQRARRTLAMRSSSPRTRSGASTIPVATLTRSALRDGAILIVELRTSATGGEVAERSVAAVHVRTSSPVWSRKAEDLRLQLTRVLPAMLAAAAPAIEQLGRRQLREVRPRYVHNQARFETRARAISSIRDSTARRLIQAGLFDLRVRPARGSQTIGAHLDQDQQAADGNAQPLVTHAELRAVLLVRRR
jgi:superfamily II DNA or RNA helicase